MKVKDQVAEHLNRLTQRPLSRLDRMLLKGFYTNDRTELENPSLLAKDRPNPNQVSPHEPNNTYLASNNSQIQLVTKEI